MIYFIRHKNAKKMEHLYEKEKEQFTKMFVWTKIEWQDTRRNIIEIVKNVYNDE